MKLRNGGILVAAILLSLQTVCIGGTFYFSSLANERLDYRVYRSVDSQAQVTANAAIGVLTIHTAWLTTLTFAILLGCAIDGLMLIELKRKRHL